MFNVDDQAGGFEGNPPDSVPPGHHELQVLPDNFEESADGEDLEDLDVVLAQLAFADLLLGQPTN